MKSTRLKLISLLSVILITINIYFLSLQNDKIHSLVEYTNQVSNDIIINLNQYKTESSKANKLINPHDFNYILNPKYKICGGDLNDDVLLLAMVPIAAYNFINRLIIRTTWTNKNISPRLRFIFLVGNSYNETINKKLKEEYEMYGDIVQEDFMDTYRNLTLKTIMGIKWSSNYCSNAKFVLKIDDDMLLNTPRVMNYLDDMLKKNKTSNRFMCNPLWESVVIRDNSSRFYVSKEEFPADYYDVCKYFIS